ncbi:MULTISPECIES: glutathione binding-like protein [unclassified Novosphingobium]|uniref:glutathione binding-like protein n=1 Tax=unclassified Novosphingobium TaxID=2644732 RepID=UPI001494915F|nr:MULTISPECIES: glutathione binding-like protein [unclassified Novosphingobium]MBB3356992.1 glutathione S-transferase [Novosphingobium sp. BK256]MBB3373393.1 glutathione S-transferase [Novosphingobium sp. BK280]MBB3377762.1 glutathione S-transferase [Novosphingobium sp. BK258]MBB3418827.1 glutathione S-transferase [Novosphingobium sp. BK267]MBB3450338.1 glutathione S-transferase [Novosphingobium sp. BK352]
MKLYYAHGACSLAALIAANEVGVALELIRVDIRTIPHILEDGTDLQLVNPKGYVPVLGLDDGDFLTEGVAILQYLNDQRVDAPADQSGRAWYRTQEWLTFIATELHKGFSPWLFHPEYGEQAADVARSRIAERFNFLERHLQTDAFLLGAQFSVADAYCFAIARWAPGKGLDLSRWPALSSYLERLEARPSIVDALRRHG